MKFNWKWFFENSFILVIIIGCILVLGSIHTISIDLLTKGFMYCIVAAGVLLGFIYLLYDIINGKTFYRYRMIPIEEFKTSVYDNMIVLSLGGLAWSYTYKKDEILKLKEIKSLHFYNIEKVLVEWDILPYQQLEKRKET